MTGMNIYQKFLLLLTDTDPTIFRKNDAIFNVNYCMNLKIQIEFTKGD